MLRKTAFAAMHWMTICTAAFAGSDLGDWQVDRSNGHVHMLALATTENGGDADLVIVCGEDTGFELHFMRAKTADLSALTKAYLVIDHRPPIEVQAATDTPTLATFSMLHAEAAERAVSSARRIGVRFDDGANTETYFFKFKNLAAGRALLLKSCPA